MTRNQCCEVSLSLVVPYEEVLPKRAYSTSAGIGHYSFMWIENKPLFISNIRAGARKISSLEGAARFHAMYAYQYSRVMWHLTLSIDANPLLMMGEKSESKGANRRRFTDLINNLKEVGRCMHKERCLRKRLTTQRTEYRNSYPISRNSIDKTSDFMP